MSTVGTKSQKRVPLVLLHFRIRPTGQAPACRIDEQDDIQDAVTR